MSAAQCILLEMFAIANFQVYLNVFNVKLSFAMNILVKVLKRS